MALFLHNPASEAHLEDLKDRLLTQSAFVSRSAREGSCDQAQIEMLLGVVRSMDKGLITSREAIETFTHHGFASFSKWLIDMVDEGVYLDTRLSRAV